MTEAHGQLETLEERDRVLTGVNVTLLNILPVPLTDARTASVGEDETADLLEGGHLAVTSDGGTDLLGTGGNGELALGRQTVLVGLASDGSSAGHVLVRRVGARTDEGNLKLLGPAVLLDRILELGEGSSQVGGERTVDVGFELGQVLQRCSSANAREN